MTLTDSCLLSGAKHQLVIKDAIDVTVDNNMIYQDANAAGSIIDIAAVAKNIAFTNNTILTESVNSGMMLRYLQGSDPEKARAYFANNVSRYPSSIIRQTYTDELSRYSFKQHSNRYGDNTYDRYQHSESVAEEVIDASVKAPECGLDIRYSECHTEGSCDE